MHVIGNCLKCFYTPKKSFSAAAPLIILMSISFLGCSDSNEEADNIPHGDSVDEKYTYSYQLAADNYNMPTAGTIFQEYADFSEGKTVENLVDGDWESSFYVPNKEFSILWKGEKPVSVCYYSILADGDRSAPTSWSLYGSNDNVEWTELDNRIR